MSNSLCNCSTDSLSVEECILKLVKISLERKASSIAVRFDPVKHKVQVVDNGIGFTKYELSCIFNEKGKNHNQENIFDKISSLSNVVIVTSRSEFSSSTYVKIVAVNNVQKLFQGYNRPSIGTTVSVYGFNTCEWNNESDKDCSISYVIAAIALMELKVSFTLRNDDNKKVILNIGKPHSPWEVLQYMNNNHVYELSYQSISQMLQETSVNHDAEEFKSIEETSNLQSISVSSKLPNVQVNIIHNNNILSPLSEWSNWSYNPNKLGINKNANDHDNKLFSSLNQVNTFDDNFINLSQMSVWSDWSYHPENVTNIEDVTNIRVYNMKYKFDECRISGNTINSLQILKQINKEFIVALTNENGKKLLIMIDQHAVHERIRYEWLLENYREKKDYKYFSIKLDKNLVITDIEKNLLKVIVLHKKALSRVGIHIKSVIDSTTCIVDAVPMCFVKKIRNYKYESNLYRLIKNVRQLLLEVAGGLTISQSVLPPVLPITINNVIASEACHEAIKFGDPLSVKDCTLLIQALQDTKAPTRCAHGRPSIIPILDVSDLEKRKKSSANKRLNFESLKNRIQMRN